MFIGIASIFLFHYLQDEIKVNNPEYNEILDKEEFIGNIQKIEVTKDQIYQGNLLLINNKYPVYQDSIKKDIIDLCMHKE